MIDKFFFIFLFFLNSLFVDGDGDWGLGIGDWGLGIGPNPQSPIPNPQTPKPKPQIPIPSSLKNIKFCNYKKKK